MEHFSLLFDTFLKNFYWIDITIIAGVVAGVFFLILVQSYAVYRTNKNSNKTLTEIRTEIYQEYEKNFFL